jgi:spore maturation protein CgeB
MQKKFPLWEQNQALKLLDKNLSVQYKPRVIEAMRCKCLNLVYKDDWNAIENWFNPNKDFLYWSNLEQLKKRINDITQNYSNYWPIVEHAYKTSEEYSIENYFPKILKKELL